ncbi:hypothetical protein [Sphingobacterium sp. BN32]|uniref:hypothetical protein n=1 Tax=Sphingobacterium sp. BN32 TaxID=3058432 RepID=UPI00265CBAC8|nr:hypothetical protein [Sphingobacterium sp. BN32]WKK59364.1 hypothetical protein QYC40_03845 [Sphingobacterium sp. BN32]
MGKLLLVLGVSMMIASCGLKNSSDSFKEEKSLRVEFVGTTTPTISNTKGKATLFAVAANLADAAATEIAVVDFDAKAIPFNVDFELPKDYLNLIEPKVRKGDSVNYYVAIAWDSNADGKIEDGDVMIDFDKQFPHVKLGKQTQQVYVK